VAPLPPPLEERRLPVLNSNLLNLSLPLLERAFQFLADPQRLKPPQELLHLEMGEWMYLQAVLDRLEYERVRSPVH
jgi:hypothetical protein